MALPFLSNSQARRLDQLLSVDLGAKVSKAIHLQRKGDRFSLVNFAVQDAPVFEKSLSADALAEHLRSLLQPFGAKAKHLVMAIGPNDALLRNAEMPQVPPNDMRVMLKYNAKNYLQQELSDYVYDCYILPARSSGKPGAEAGKSSGQPKVRVLVAGAKRVLLENLQEAAKAAGFLPTMVVPALIGPANAFEMAQPEAFSKEVIALVDVGFKQSTITILLNGELTLSRVVGIGGDRLTQGLAEAMGISYAEAEGIKVGMPEEVQTTMQPLLSSLGRELRASVDFFEHQQDKAVSQAFVSGGSSRSDYILQALQAELMVPCKTWNPTSFLTLALPPKQMSEIEQVAPTLAVAVGAGAAAM